ncbi:MAG TPA: hypothetical protein VMW62_00810 [Chloroflexota bacterium]|nr:hypothetical protein [Chloroflexota bacterium]
MAMHSFEDVVEDYRARFQEQHHRQLRWFAIQQSLEAAIEQAGMAVTPAGKRFNHQRRISRAALRGWTDSLLTHRSTIQQVNRFAVLHGLLAKIGAGIHGIGPWVVYDTATRIGAFLKLAPDRVYLHAGTEVGAQALGFHRRPSLSKGQLPGPFQRLSADEIEDCLCIYKRLISAIVKQTPPATGAPTGCQRAG